MVVVPTGIEPVSEAPETSILSVELRDQFSVSVGVLSVRVNHNRGAKILYNFV